MVVTPSTPTPAAVMALEWSAVIERTTGALPRGRGLLSRRRRQTYRYTSRLAVARDTNIPHTFAGVFVDSRTGGSLLCIDDGPEAWSTSVADVAVPGAMRTPQQFRFRAFFLSHHSTRHGATTLAAQQRIHADTPAAIATGARIEASLAGRVPIVIPRVLDQGVIRGRMPGGGAADWVVETALDGTPIRPDQVSDTVVELIRLLAESWCRLGIEHGRPAAADLDRASAAFAALVHDPPAGMWPDDVERDRLGREVARALAEQRPLTISVSHGDPGAGNALRLRDGRLALTDWEDAAHRPVAHDVVKALMSAPEPIALLSAVTTPPEFRRAMSAAGAADWDRQLGIALIMFLRGWHHRHVRARRRNSTPANNARMQRMLRVLDHLLAS
jgi:hypothetical protein